MELILVGIGMVLASGITGLLGEYTESPEAVVAVMAAVLIIIGGILVGRQKKRTDE